MLRLMRWGGCGTRCWDRFGFLRISDFVTLKFMFDFYEGLPVLMGFGEGSCGIWV